MFVTKHDKFLLTSIENVLQDAVLATSGLTASIDNFPIVEYVLQSLFLKMTGFQEQKLKCLCWDLSTNNFEFRVWYLSKIALLGECSSFNAKNLIFKEIRKIFQIKICLKEIKKNVYEETKQKIVEVFFRSELKSCIEHQYRQFKKADFSDFVDKSQNELLSKPLQKIYALLYSERNRCAHNLKCYQQHLPNFDVLANKDYSFQNYFYFFWLLFIIDSIFVCLYKKIKIQEN